MIGESPLLLCFNGPAIAPDADTLAVAAALLGAESYQALTVNHLVIRSDPREDVIGRTRTRQTIPRWSPHGVQYAEIEAVITGAVHKYPKMRSLDALKKVCHAALLEAQQGEKFLAFRDQMLERHPGTTDDVIRSAWEIAHPSLDKPGSAKP